MHQLRTQDEIWLETRRTSKPGIEYEDYLKKCAEFQIHASEEYKAKVEASKDRMRAIINKSAAPGAAQEGGAAATATDTNISDETKKDR